MASHTLNGLEHTDATPDERASARTLLEAFESVGDNCEFGILQRDYDVHSLSLFRFNFIHIEPLIAGLEKRFADIAQPGNVRVRWEGEWMVSEARYGLDYHTFNTDDTLDPDRLIAEQSRWLRYMAEKFLESLALGDRIFVRKGEEPSRAHDIAALHSAMRRFGSSTLLWVCTADTAHPAGLVEHLENGLMRGWIKQFAPYENAPGSDADGWLGLCAKAWGRWKEARLVAPGQPTLVPPGALDFGGWSGSEVATAQLVWSIPERLPGQQVMSHALVADRERGQDVFGCVRDTGLRRGDIVVASTYVWIPEDFGGQAVGLILLGLPSIRIQDADVLRRSEWQRIWVSAVLDSPVVHPRLRLVGLAGSMVYTTGWRLDRGDYLSW